MSTIFPAGIIPQTQALELLLALEDIDLYNTVTSILHRSSNLSTKREFTNIMINIPPIRMVRCNSIDVREDISLEKRQRKREECIFNAVPTVEIKLDAFGF